MMMNAGRQKREPMVRPRAVRILVSSSDDYAKVTKASSRRHEWTVPKLSAKGDPAVLFYAGAGFFATARVASDVHSPQSGIYRAELREIELIEPITIENAREILPEWRWLDYPRSYTTLEGEQGERLLRLTREAFGDPSRTFNEGTPGYGEHVSYERSRAAREACIRHHGQACVVCGFNFSEAYSGISLVVVHHLRPLGTVRDSHQIDPKKDLIPVCANCHAVIHSRQEPYTPAEVRQMLIKAQGTQTGARAR
jgi:hypothetical protein